MVISLFGKFWINHNSAFGGYLSYATHREEKQRVEEYKPKRKTEKYYAKVLGLTDSVTPEELKQIYKSLAMQYHPDKVAHLGPKLQQVAHEEMKKINEAYAFLKEKYSIEN